MPEQPTPEEIERVKAWAKAEQDRKRAESNAEWNRRREAAQRTIRDAFEGKTIAGIAAPDVDYIYAPEYRGRPGFEFEPYGDGVQIAFTDGTNVTITANYDGGFSVDVRLPPGNADA